MLCVEFTNGMLGTYGVVKARYLSDEWGAGWRELRLHNDQWEKNSHWDGTDDPAGDLASIELTEGGHTYLLVKNGKVRGLSMGFPYGKY
jgi:hypothetical protein